VPRPKRPTRAQRKTANRGNPIVRGPGATAGRGKGGGGGARKTGGGGGGDGPGGSAGEGAAGVGERKARRGTMAPAPVAGLVVRRGRNLEVEPLFQKGPGALPSRGGVKLQPGDLVLYTWAPANKVRVVRVIGKKGVLADVIEALLLDNLIERGFSAQVLAEAVEAADVERRRDAYRVDQRDRFTFTVDPETARDYDDALSFESGDDGAVTVFVHIADVSYYVNEGTALDEEALRRTTSVYLSTGVEPMLPPLLSSGVCSLQPGVDRKTVTVEMQVDAKGHVQQVRFYRSTIRSDSRLTYDQFEAVLQGESVPDPLLAAALALGRPLAALLRERRFEQGSLRITSTEPEFHWSATGDLLSAHAAEELESHHFIEEFMILANTQVATFLERKHAPTVYRVHDMPDPFRLDHLLDVLASLDVPTPPFDPLSATAIEVRRVAREMSEYLDRNVPRGRGKAALVQQLLRAQARAVYQTQNIGHFGLALGTYCHFTSPIRRYPDLLVHRALLAELGIGPDPTTSTLADWAEHCSRMERQAAKIERSADDITMAFLLRQRLDREGWGSVFEGQIVGLVPSGAFVLFEQLHEGFLPARELPGDYYELNDLESALVGRRTGEAYRLADIVRIRVAAVDEARGRVDLVLAHVDG
jgi:ribonuclease R